MKIIETREYFGLHRGKKETMPGKIIAEKYKIDYKVLAPDLAAKEDRWSNIVKTRHLSGAKQLNELVHGSAYYSVKLLPAFEWRTSWMPTVLWEIVREHPDLLVCSPGYTFSLKDYAVMVAKKLLGIPLVFMDAGDEIFRQSMIKRIMYPVERITARSADMVITYSDIGRDRWHKGYAIPYDAIKVIPKGIDLRISSAESSVDRYLKEYDLPGDFNVLFCSRLVKEKGPHVFVSVAQECRARGLTDINFIVAGDGFMRAYLEGYCRDNGLTNVYFTGMVPHQMVRWLYARAQVFVMPYTGDLYAAGFGTVVAEAMAMGTSIIIGLKGFEKAVPLKHMETAVFTRPGDIREITGALVRLYNDAGLRSALGSNARVFAEKYMDWDAQADLYFQLYSDLVRKKSRPKNSRRLENL